MIQMNEFHPSRGMSQQLPTGSNTSACHRNMHEAYFKVISSRDNAIGTTLSFQEHLCLEYLSRVEAVVLQSINDTPRKLAFSKIYYRWKSVFVIFDSESKHGEMNAFQSGLHTRKSCVINPEV